MGEAGRGCSGRKPSKGWLKAKREATRIQRKTANKRLNFLHQESNSLVNALGFIATEVLSVKAMTASAKGTVEEPGKNVKQKAGLNQGILDTAPAAFLSITKAKAEEAMAERVDVPTKSVKPSQTCRKCGSQRKKTLADRTHVCEVCGHTEKRDVNAAWVMLNWALWGSATGRVSARHGGASRSKLRNLIHTVRLGGVVHSLNLCTSPRSRSEIWESSSAVWLISVTVAAS